MDGGLGGWSHWRDPALLQEPMSGNAAPRRLDEAETRPTTPDVSNKTLTPCDRARGAPGGGGLAAPTAPKPEWVDAWLELPDPSRAMKMTSERLGCDALINSPAPLQRPGPDTGGISSSASLTLLNPEALAFAALVRQAQRNLVKDKAYRATPVGAEVGRFLRALKWKGCPQNTLDTYEIVLARLAYDHAHYKQVGEFTTEALRDFLDDHWGDAKPDTRANRLAAVKSFFRWQVKERGLGENPAEAIDPPKKGIGRPASLRARPAREAAAGTADAARPDLRAAARPGSGSARTSCGCCGSVTSTWRRARSSSTGRAARSR